MVHNLRLFLWVVYFLVALFLFLSFFFFFFFFSFNTTNVGYEDLNFQPQGKEYVSITAELCSICLSSGLVIFPYVVNSFASIFAITIYFTRPEFVA